MENVIDFVTKFAASFETPVNEETEEEEEEDDDTEFLNFLFNFLLEVVSLMQTFGLGKKSYLKVYLCFHSISYPSLYHLFLSHSLTVQAAMLCGFVFVSWRISCWAV